MEEGTEGGLRLHTMQEACQALDLSPRTLRRLLETLGSLVPTQPGPAGGPRHLLTSEGLKTLARAARLLQQGLSPDQARAWLEGEVRPGDPAWDARQEAAAREEAGPLAGASSEAVLRTLAVRLDHAVRSLAEAQTAWARDRDRLLTALARTHQELRFLRYELASGRPRRLRHRRAAPRG